MMNSKMILYAVLPRLYDNRCTNPVVSGSIETNGCGKLAAFTEKALTAIQQLGATHIWYIGLVAHASQTDYSHVGIRPSTPAIVKGRAGSPYAIRDYYDVDPDLAKDPAQRMEEFHGLIERTHRAGMGFVMDFVPNHVAREYHSDTKPASVSDLGEGDDPQQVFSPVNCFYYFPDQALRLEITSPEAANYHEEPARASGNDCFSPHVGQNDWYETIKLNYGVDYLGGGAQHLTPIPTTWLRMREILFFWAEKGVDGFRCDMVEMVPLAFWRWVIPQLKSRFPVIMIAEIYQPALYEDYVNAGFDYLYDKVGMYDALRAAACNTGPAWAVSDAAEAGRHFGSRMLHFTENHDEQRLASDFVVGDAERAFAATVVAATIGTQPFMLYFGQELGERGMDAEGFSGVDGRTTIFDYWSLDKLQRRIHEGAYDDELLNEEERKLLHLHARLLHDICPLTIISEGAYYDLGYAQSVADGFRHESHLAYSRYNDREVLIAVANFSPDAVALGLRLPAHAFNAWPLRNNVACRMTDLFSGDFSLVAPTHQAPFPLTLPAHSCRLLLISPLAS